MKVFLLGLSWANVGWDCWCSDAAETASPAAAQLEQHGAR